MNLALLALLHKNCVTSPSLSDDQRKAILENGPDASLNCQIKSGADANLSQRGDQQLNPVMIPNLKSQFESALGAVVAFEVMKKRGKKEQ